MPEDNKIVLGFAHWGTSEVTVLQMIETVQYAADHGIYEIDCAPHYGNGTQENILGVALRALSENIRSKIKISTKVGRIIDTEKKSDTNNGFTISSGFSQYFDYSYKGIKSSFQQSQLRLSQESVHALYLHDLDANTHKEQFTKHYEYFVNDGYRAFDEFKKEGKVSVSGIGSNNVDNCLNLINDGRFNIDRVMIAGCYNLLNCLALDKLFPLCEEKNIELYIAAPYGGGLLSGQEGNSFFRYENANQELLDRVERIRKICNQYSITLPHAAFQFVHMHPQVKRVVVGARTKEELKETLTYAHTPISPEFWSALKNESLIPENTKIPLFNSVLNVTPMRLKEKIPFIDSHIHLWDKDHLRYPWLNQLPALNRTFLPEHLQIESKELQIESFIFVQADCDPQQSLDEVAWVTEWSKKNSRIRGIVAHAPLEEGQQVREHLQVLAKNPLVKGVRRLLQSETDDFCLQTHFIEGVQMLAEFNLSFDICIKATQMPSVIKLIKLCPDVTFILDHLGKPNVAENQLQPWQNDLEELAKLPNVYCKISGLITESNHQTWSVEDIKPYVLHAIKVFSVDRVLFGSDWPVVKLAGSYIQWVNALNTILLPFQERDIRKIFYENSQSLYKLDNPVKRMVASLLFHNTENLISQKVLDTDETHHSKM